MKKTILVAAIIVSFLTVGTSSSHAFGRRHRTPAPAPTPAPVPAYNYSADEVEGMRLINQHRLAMGLGAVTQNDFLANLSMGHNNYMIQKGVASHDFFTDRSNAAMKQLKATRVGEIVAYNYSTPNSVLTAWLNSDGHRKVIETPNFKRFGYSLRLNPQGKKYYTVLFSD